MPVAVVAPALRCSDIGRRRDGHELGRIARIISKSQVTGAGLAHCPPYSSDGASRAFRSSAVTIHLDV